MTINLDITHYVSLQLGLSLLRRVSVSLPTPLPVNITPYENDEPIIIQVLELKFKEGGGHDLSKWAHFQSWDNEKGNVSINHENSRQHSSHLTSQIISSTFFDLLNFAFFLINSSPSRLGQALGIEH